MTTLTVRKQDGAFVLDSGARASLRTGWTWRCGEIRTGTGLWTVEPTDRRRIGFPPGASTACRYGSTRAGRTCRGPAGWRAGRPVAAAVSWYATGTASRCASPADAAGRSASTSPASGPSWSWWCSPPVSR